MAKRRRYNPGRKYNTALWKLRDDRTGFPILSKDAVRDGNKPELVVHKDAWEPFLNVRLPTPIITVELPDPARPFTDPTLGNIQYCYIVTAANGIVVGVSCSTNQFTNRTLANETQITQYCPVVNSSIMLYSNTISPGNVLGTISAYDPTGQTLSYSLLAANTTSTTVANSTQFFSVNSTTAGVNFLTNAGFDFNANYTLNVQAIETTGISKLGNVGVITVAPQFTTDYTTLLSAYNPNGWWKMSETTGNTLADSSFNGNPLILAGGSHNFVLGHLQLFPNLPGKSIYEDTAGFSANVQINLGDYNYTTALSGLIATKCTSASVIATNVLIARYTNLKLFEFSYDPPSLLTLRLAANGNSTGVAATIQANMASIGHGNMAVPAYVGFAYNGRSQTVNLYAQGQQLSTTITGTIPSLLNANIANTTFNVGCDSASSNLFFGDLQQPAVFANTLTAAQMNLLYTKIL